MDRIRVDEQRGLGPPKTRWSRPGRPRNAHFTRTIWPFSGVSQHPIGDGCAKVVVLSTLVVLAAIALLFTCLRTGLSLPEWVQGQRGPVERVVRSDVASVSFITVLITTASVVVLVYEVFRILGPGPSNCPVPRWRGPVSWIATTYFALAAAAVLYSHARLLPPGASAWPGRSGAPPSGAPSSPVSLFTGGVPTPVAATSGCRL